MQHFIGRAVLVVAAVGLLSACAPRTDAHIDYIDTFRLGAVSYTAQPQRTDRALTASDLGEEVARVRFKVAGSGKDPMYQLQDGDATLLDAGTPLFAVKGYKPGFRLAVRSAGGIRLYECDDNLAAKSGADLLDLAGKVEYIGINSPQGGLTEVGHIKDRAAIDRLVALALAAPVRPQAATEGQRHFIAFHLKDGSTATRVYWPQSGVLGRGIVLPAAWRTAVEGALQAAPVTSAGRSPEPVAGRISQEQALAIAMGMNARATWQVGFVKDFLAEGNGEQKRRPVWVVQTLSPASNTTLWVDVETGTVLTVRESEAPAPSAEVAVSHERALAIARGIDARAAWRADLLLDFEYQGKSGETKQRPAWIVQALAPTPDKTVWVDADTGEVLAVRPGSTNFAAQMRYE